MAAFLDEIQHAGDMERVVRARIKRGDTIPGFGHPLYPDGDPRAAALLPQMGRSAALQSAIAAVHAVTGRDPSIDFALVGIERGHGLPSGAALALFAIGRAAGWIAHAFEQQANRSLIRPRARFVADAAAPEEA